MEPFMNYVLDVPFKAERLLLSFDTSTVFNFLKDEHLTQNPK